MKINFGEWMIRSFSEKDISAIARHANNPNIAANLRNRFPSPYTVKDAKSWINRVRTQKPECNFAISSQREAIGCIGLEFQEDIHYRSAEIGYWLSEDYWGRGIMTQAVILFTEYAFKTYEAIRIFASPFASNTGSIRVLEKAGYQMEGRLRKNVTKKGKVLDQLMFSKLRE